MVGIISTLISNATTVIVSAVISWITAQYICRKELVENQNKELHELNDSLKNHIFSIKSYIDYEAFYFEQIYIYQCKKEFVIDEISNKLGILKAQFSLSLAELERLVNLNQKFLSKDFGERSLILIRKLKYQIWDMYTHVNFDQYGFLCGLSDELGELLKEPIIHTLSGSGNIPSDYRLSL